MISGAPSPEQIAQLITELREGLLATGSVSGNQAELGVPVDVWRRAARRAARELGRPVQTLTHRGWVNAVLRDWPADAREETVQLGAMRRAVAGADAIEARSARGCDWCDA